jgi:Flp pilus assembly protein TadG
LKTRSRLRRVRGERGQSLVEFSFACLALVMLLFGVIEMSRMLLVYTSVANAAKAGARYAIVNGVDVNAGGPTTDDSNVVTTVKNFASAGGLNTANLTVHVNYYTYTSAGGLSAACNTAACNSPGSWVRVTASYPYDPFVGYFNLPSISLASATEGVITW